jgi:hypothetical protein
MGYLDSSLYSVGVGNSNEQEAQVRSAVTRRSAVAHPTMLPAAHIHLKVQISLGTPKTSILNLLRLIVA